MTKHALIVDDSQVNQLILRKILESVDIQAEVAGSGQEALALTDQTPFDLIFMDIQMPVMDGYETTRGIRSHGLNKAAPIVAVTANASAEDELLCREAGMDFFLPKPVEREKIINLLGSLSDRPPNTTTSTATLSASDLEILYQKVGRDLAFMEMILQSFTEDIEALLRDLEAVFENQDLPASQPLLHQARGLLSAIAADHMGQILADLDADVKNGAIPEAKLRMKRLYDQTSAYIEEADRFILQKKSETEEPGARHD